VACATDRVRKGERAGNEVMCSIGAVWPRFPLGPDWVCIYHHWWELQKLKWFSTVKRTTNEPPKKSSFIIR
jgi:hypothetical protein